MVKRNWWADLKENLRALGVIVVAIGIDLPAALFVHDKAAAAEPVAIFISLGLGLACPAWYLRTRRRGWLVTLISTTLLAFSLASALLHDRLVAGAIFIVLISVASTALVIASVVVSVMLHRRMRRLDRALESEVREVGNEVFGEGPLKREGLFRDDGQRLVVYPSRWRLLGQCALQMLALGGFAAIYAFVPMGNVLIRVALLVLLGLLAFVLAAGLVRLIRRAPALVVGPDGIRDGGSLIATGMGLLRWNEILGVTVAARTEGWVTRKYLSILVTDVQAIRQRQPVWKRFALIIIRQPPSMVSISPLLMDRPADELVRQIEQYAREHAPADWPTWMEDEDAPAPEGGAESNIPKA